jgi:hypothetical protein
MKLYHGTSKKIAGKKLIPKQARSAKNKASNQVAIYATDRKDFAIVMALLHQGGVSRFCRINFLKGKAIGTIFEGWPNQKYFYLYTLPSKDFALIPRSKGEWISHKEVVPSKIEKLETKDYLHLLRKGTPGEFKKYRELIKRAKARKLK